MSLRLVTMATAVAAAFAVLPAAAQTKPAAQAAAPADNTIPPISGPQPDWVKMCQKDEKQKIEVCQTSRDLRAETGQTLASVALREQKTEKGARRAIVMAIPPGMQIPPGVRVLVDEKQAFMGKYSVCFASACMVEAELTDAVLQSMRKGQTLNLQVVSPANKGVLFPISLEGLAKALDGAPLDPKAVQDDQKKLNEELRKKAEDALKALKDQPAQQ